MTMDREELLRDIASETAESLERLKIAAGLAQSGLHTLTIVNGGALVALFTLIGTGKLAFATLPLWSAFSAFVLGIAAALVAFLAGHASQDRLSVACAMTAHNRAAELAGSKGKDDAANTHHEGNRLVNVASCSAALSILLFVTGSGLALAAFT